MEERPVDAAEHGEGFDNRQRRPDGFIEITGDAHTAYANANQGEVAKERPRHHGLRVVPAKVHCLLKATAKCRAARPIGSRRPRATARPYNPPK